MLKKLLAGLELQPCGKRTPRTRSLGVRLPPSCLSRPALRWFSATEQPKAGVERQSHLCPVLGSPDQARRYRQGRTLCRTDDGDENEEGEAALAGGKGGWVLLQEPQETLLPGAGAQRTARQAVTNARCELCWEVGRGLQGPHQQETPPGRHQQFPSYKQPGLQSTSPAAAWVPRSPGTMRKGA